MKYESITNKKFSEKHLTCDNDNILWKSASKRLGVYPQYEEWKNSYNRGKISFKSENKTTKEEINKIAKAIKYRINGGDWDTGKDSIFRRMGSLQINEHYVKSILDVAQEIEGVSIFPLYHGSYKKQKGYVLRNGEVAVLFIAKNWINPLHNSLLPDINEALYDLEEDLKKHYHVKKVWKVLFTPQIEKKGQRTLDFELSNGIKHYPLPYISPKTLSSRVKEHTGVNIRRFYPAEEEWNLGIISLLRAYLTKLLDKVKKKAKAVRFTAPNWLKKKILSPILHTSGLNINHNIKGENLELKPYKPPLKTKYEDPPPRFSSQIPPKRSVSIEIPEDKLRCRIAVFKKRAKNGVVRTYNKLYFYKVHEVEESNPFRTYRFNKQIIIKPKGYKLIYGLKKALNNCIYALMNYRTSDKLKEHLRRKFLKVYSQELLRIQ